MSMALLIVGLLISLVGSLMVVVAAFRRSLLWGLGTLLIPLVWLIFVLLNWEESRRGFLINLGGVAVVVLGFFLMPASTLSGVGESSRVAWEEPLEDLPPAPGPEDAPEAPGTADLPLSAGEALSPGAAERAEGEPPAARRARRRSSSPAGPPSRPRGVTPPRARSSREQVVSVEEAASYIGELVEIVKTDGTVVKARIRRVDRRRVVIEQPVGGGSITFSLPRQVIRELRVSRR